jgi:hypothetical protein
VVDQMGDRHSLSHSLRVMPVDLSPHGFERVYAVPGRDDLLMRTNGALYAVFDQSTYTRDPQKRGAMRAVIPAATVFYIGRPDFRTIRSTGMRDLDFVPGDASRAARPSSALGSMHGVTRLEGAPVDGRASDAGAQIVDGRAHHPSAEPASPGRAAAPASGQRRLDRQQSLERCLDRDLHHAKPAALGNQPVHLGLREVQPFCNICLLLTLYEVQHQNSVHVPKCFKIIYFFHFGELSPALDEVMIKRDCP